MLIIDMKDSRRRSTIGTRHYEERSIVWMMQRGGAQYKASQAEEESREGTAREESGIRRCERETACAGGEELAH